MNKKKKKKKVDFFGLLAPMAISLVQPVISSVIKYISGSGVTRARTGYINKKF